jgi:OFA family oxalate/formate antiporter-like MFS transporter
MSVSKKNQTLKMDPRFKIKGVLVVIAVFAGFMLAASMTNDSVNILTTTLPELRGWSQTMITLPISVGGWIALVVTVVTGTLIKRIGSYNCFKLGFALMAVSVIVIGIVPLYGIYFAAIVLTRCGQALAFFASVKLCTDWFFTYRGRVLGIVTIGPPVSSSVLIPILSWLTINMSFRSAWIILGCLGIAMVVFLSFLGKSTPEDYGWQQDGFNRSPEQLAQMGMTDDTPNIWSLKLMTQKKEFWLLTAAGALGGMVFGSGLMLFIPVVTSAGLSTAQAFIAFSVGNALAIPFSFISGVIDDKFGTKKAYIIVLAFTVLMPFLFFLLLLTHIAIFAYCAAFCVGVLAGCLLNLNPSIKTWAFGRKAFVDFNRTAQAVENGCVPFGVMLLSLIYDITGVYTLGYLIYAIVMLVLFVLMLFLKSHAPEVIGFEAAIESAGVTKEPLEEAAL